VVTATSARPSASSTGDRQRGDPASRIEQLNKEFDSQLSPTRGWSAARATRDAAGRSPRQGREQPIEIYKVA
jgi:hypothetical protein